MFSRRLTEKKNLVRGHRTEAPKKLYHGKKKEKETKKEKEKDEEKKNVPGTKHITTPGAHRTASSRKKKSRIKKGKKEKEKAGTRIHTYLIHTWYVPSLPCLRAVLSFRYLLTLLGLQSRFGDNWGQIT